MFSSDPNQFIYFEYLTGFILVMFDKFLLYKRVSYIVCFSQRMVIKTILNFFPWIKNGIFRTSTTYKISPTIIRWWLSLRFFFPKKFLFWFQYLIHHILLNYQTKSSSLKEHPKINTVNEQIQKVDNTVFIDIDI